MVIINQWHFLAVVLIQHSIGSEGEVIFINYNSIINSPKAQVESLYLTDGEKASSVACCDHSVAVLSSNGRVFYAPITLKKINKFSEVLKGKEIVYLSGKLDHILTVTKEGRVFGRGSNESSQLGLGKETESVYSFFEIPSLEKYEIRAAYAGGWSFTF